MRKNKFLKIHLQLFAQEEIKDNNSENNQEDVTNEENEKTYTKEDIDKMKKEWLLEVNKNKNNEVKAAIENEKRLSSLSEEDRKKEEQLEKEKSLQEREKLIAFKERLSDIKDELSQRKLPLNFAEYFAMDEVENALEKIKVFEKDFRSAVEEEVNKRIKGVSLKVGDSKVNEDIGSQIAKTKNEKKLVDINPWK